MPTPLKRAATIPIRASIALKAAARAAGPAGDYLGWLLFRPEQGVRWSAPADNGALGTVALDARMALPRLTSLGSFAALVRPCLRSPLEALSNESGGRASRTLGSCSRAAASNPRARALAGGFSRLTVLAQKDGTLAPEAGFAYTWPRVARYASKYRTVSLPERARRPS